MIYLVLSDLFLGLPGGGVGWSGGGGVESWRVRRAKRKSHGGGANQLSPGDGTL